ncbi:MAG: hypothetical protein COV48_12560 [Elusimicrobia bacterium CG11_big_fil_rev_8_21_14_0_20_64_6]|nr:MAG: hypothetical protein COV48_12560 [Elusimicrobia bacterium CG11_big_fil_rev_8_21_14_0_20_64_6]
MQRSLTILAIGLALSSGRVFALEPQAPPSPVAGVAPRSAVTHKDGDDYSLFVGHYGEAIKIPYGWTAKAELHEATEIVYIHRKSHDDFGYKPFQPKPADFKLENFAPMGLMELVVVPKNVPGGLRSLQEIRLAKERELEAAGAAYETSDEGSAWPRGTFRVGIWRPYRVVQTYSQSAKEFYIFTEGGFLEEGAYGLPKNRILEYQYAAVNALGSLLEHLSVDDENSPSGALFSVAPQTVGILHSFKAPRFLAGYGFLAAALLILALLPAKASRARFFGWSLFLFSHGTALVGFLALYLPVRFAGLMWSNLGDATLLPTLLIPAAAWLAARRFGSLHSGRVLIATGVLAALGATFMQWGPRSTSPLPVETEFFGATMVLLLLGLMSGLSFALAFGPIKNEAPR